MPPTKQKATDQTVNPTTTTGRKSPDNVRFVKFRCDPKPTFRLRSGNSLTVLKDRIRTYMWDPEITPAVSTKATPPTKVDEKDKINIEIKLKDIEQVDITSTTKANEKVIAIFTGKPVESIKGHVFSESLYFFFSSLSNKDIPGGQGGVEDYMKMWKSLESRGLDVVTASSANVTSDAEEDEDDDDDAASKIAITPPKLSRKRGSKEQSPLETPISGPPSTGASLLDGEQQIPSSQPRRRKFSKTSDEGDEADATPSRKKPKIKQEITKEDKEMVALLQKPENREVVAIFDLIKKQVVKTFNDSMKKVQAQRQRTHAKLWKEVATGVSKANSASSGVAGIIKDNEAHFKLHGKEFRILVDQGQKDMNFLIVRLKEANSKVSGQRQRLLQLKSPVKIASKSPKK